MTYIEKFLPITDESLNQFESHLNDINEWSKMGVKYIRYVINEDSPSAPIHFSGTSINEINKTSIQYGDLFNRISNKSSNNIIILNSLHNRVPGDEIIRIIISHLMQQISS